MSKIAQVFEKLKEKKRAAFIPFIVAGDPDLRTTEALILKLAESGADIIEIGVPFSDPLADGPVIQAASHRALQKGVTLKEIFRLTWSLKGKEIPLVLMTYYNPVLQYGLKNFAADCRQYGVDGVIIPDLPAEEADPWIHEARPAGISTIFLVAPTSPPDRIRLADRKSEGFVYAVSITGVTGTRGNLPKELEQTVKRIKRYCHQPVAVGFGVSTPEQVREVGRFAEGVIVGSAIVKTIADHIEDPELVNKTGGFAGKLAAALRK